MDIENFDFDFKPNFIEGYIEPSEVKFPANGDIADWPRFDHIDYSDLFFSSIGGWITLFTQLHGAADLQVKRWNSKVAFGKTPTERKQARVIREIWESYVLHYKEMGKAMSRNLTKLIEESRMSGIENRVS